MKSRIFFIAACTLFLTTSITFAYQATFIPRISVSEEYTDNIFLTDSNKEHEYITIISPGFTAQILGKYSGAEISYDAGYSIYDKYDEYDGWRHNVEFSGWSELSKNTRLEVNNSFLRTEDPLRDSDIAALRAENPEALIDSTIRRSRQIYYTNTAGINLIHQFGRADSFNLGFIHSFLKNDDPDYEDNERYNPYAGLTYWFASEWGLNMNGSYTKGDFDDSDDLDGWYGSARLIKRFSRHLEGFFQYAHTSVEYDGNSEDFQVYNPSAGFVYTISKDTSFSLEMGYAILDGEESSNKSAPSGIGNLTKTFKRGSINITGSAGYEGSYFGAEGLGVAEFYELGGSATYQMTKHLSGNVFGSYRDNEYKEETPDREDKITRVGLGLTMQALEWMSLGLDYAYRTVDSTVDIEEYDENRVFFRVTLSPPHPFRTSK
ncbi:MAG: outer membrane beta-barrel protein [Deltaproteobacteria bacterium]|nr:outer membrane beta-barrel protein [Deltaproteobacteria bacterium]